MSFKYDLTASQQTPTSDSKVVLCKSFKIDIAAGSGFTTATEYELGWLPKDAQVVYIYLATPTTVSGGTVSAATLTIKVNSITCLNAINVFVNGANNTLSVQYMQGAFNDAASNQKVTYTPTLTGAGATAGVMYVTVYYVV